MVLHEEIQKALKPVILSGEPPEQDDLVEVDSPNYSVASLFDQTEDEGKSYLQTNSQTLCE